MKLWDDSYLETQGGFIDTPTGAFSSDPASVMVLNSAKGLFGTPDQPYLYRGGPGTGETYDTPLRRWLPVPHQWVSPDGASYAYAEIQPGTAQGIHVVDVRTGTDRVVPGTSGSADARGQHYAVIAYEADGIYLTRASQLSGGGLFLLDPVTAAIIQVSTDAPAVEVRVAGKQAWWTVLSSGISIASDPRVYHQYLTGAAGQHAETWFQRPGFRLHVLGVHRAGHAVVLAQSADANELWLLATPNDAKLLRTTPAEDKPDWLPMKAAVADSTGWWIGSRTGVFLASGGSFQLASSTPAVAVAGCL